AQRGRGGLRPGSRMERRLPSHRARRAHGATRSVLHGLSRYAAGAPERHATRIPVSGTALSLAEEEARHARVGRAEAPLRALSGESRPGGQHARWPASPPPGTTGTAARADGAAAARARDAAAVSGTGVRIVDALPLFCGSQSGLAR